MPKLDERLEGLAKHHENIAASIRTTLSILNGHDKERARAGLNGKLAVAVKTRKKANGEAALSPTANIALVLQKAGKKLSVEELRDALGTRDAMRAIGAAIRYGYVKATGKGKHRTFEFKAMPEAEKNE